MTVERVASRPTRLSRTRRILCGVAAAVLLLAGCGRHGKGAPEGGAAAPPPQTRLRRGVDLTQVRQERIDAYVDTVGSLEAEGQADIGAGVTGIVDEVLFREGQWVEGGKTVLIKVDQEYYQASAELARENENRARSALGLARTLQRNGENAGSATPLEERQKLSASVQLATAELAAAIASHRVADNKLRRSQVLAPYTGQINQRRITKGTYVKEETVIGTMADMSRLRLVGYIPERSAPMVRQMLRQEEQARTAFLVGSWMASPWAGLAGQALDQVGDTPAALKLAFELRPFPKQRFYGRIFYLSTVASPDTHMFECKAEVPPQGNGELRPGYSAKVRCPLPGTSASLVVPEECMRASERGWIVFRPRPETDERGRVQYDDDGLVKWVAESVTVDPGVRQPGKVEILKGVALGDWVVQRGAEALEEGTPLAFPKAVSKQLQDALGLKAK